MVVQNENSRKMAEEIVNGRTVIAVTELPYQVNKEKLKNKIESLAMPISDKDKSSLWKT